jgi:hypothetical protein
VPESVTLVPLGPELGLRERLAVVERNAAETMKFDAPWETSTKAFAVPGTVAVVPAGMAPEAVEVNAVPLAQGLLPDAAKQAV